MTTVFADTFYFLAMVNNTDLGHEKALHFTKIYTGDLVTTGWVLTELGDALAGSRQGRARFSLILQKLQAGPNMHVVSCDNSLFQEGVAFYTQRSDKEWTLTDCISFIIMNRQGIVEALTGDHHFEQAGFIAVLK